MRSMADAPRDPEALAVAKRLDCGAWHVFSVATGFQPAVEPGILPGGLSRRLRSQFRLQSSHSGRQDAALYGSQDGCRYSRTATLNTYGA